MARANPRKQAKNTNLETHANKGGRPKGALNKTTVLLKEAILRAAELAGDDLSPDNRKGLKREGGLIRYLQVQAKSNPNSFMSALLGKVLPLQITGDEESPVNITVRYEHGRRK